MSRFLIDECVGQKAIRRIPRSKGFDIKFPHHSSYKGAVDAAVLKLAATEKRVLVSAEKDFGKFRLQAEDVPDGAIWFRPLRSTEDQTGKLIESLCLVLTRDYASNPYDFRGKIIEVFPDHVVIRASGGAIRTHEINPRQGE